MQPAFDAMPSRMTFERAMLGVLVKAPNNFDLALRELPRPLRMLYCHAWQSYHFNNALR